MANPQEWDSVLLGVQKTPNIVNKAAFETSFKQSMDDWYNKSMIYLNQPQHKNILSIMNALYDEINIYRNNDNTSVVRAILYTWHIFHISKHGVDPRLYRLIQLFIDNMIKQQQLDSQGIRIVWGAIIVCNNIIYHAPSIKIKFIVACICQSSASTEMSKIPIGSYYTYPSFLHGKIDATFYLLQSYLQRGVISSNGDNVIFMRITEQVKLMYNPSHLRRQPNSHDVIFCAGTVLHKIGERYYEYYSVNPSYQEILHAGDYIRKLGFGTNKNKDPFKHTYKYGLKWVQRYKNKI